MRQALAAFPFVLILGGAVAALADLGDDTFTMWLKQLAKSKNVRCSRRCATAASRR